MPVQINPMPSRKSLDRVVPRAGRFLRAVSRSLLIRSALEARGYDEEEHQRGWAAFLTASGYRPPASKSEVPENATVAVALATIEEWHKPNFRIVRATLEFRHPEQHAFLFDQLSTGSGAAAVGAVTLFLDRLDALEASPERKATRKADLAALEVIEARGVTKEERARLRGLVASATAWSGAAPAPASTAIAEEPGEALITLYAWYREWSETARVVIKRRDQLVRLGLARRKAAKPGDAEPTEDEDEDGEGDEG